MLDQIHLLAAVTVLGVLEQGRDHRMQMPKYLLDQSAVPPLISFHFHISLALPRFSDSGLVILSRFREVFNKMSAWEALPLNWPTFSDQKFLGRSSPLQKCRISSFENLAYSSF